MFFVYRFFVIFAFLFSLNCRCRVRNLQNLLTASTNPTVVRVIANSETVSTTINTTTKTTVNIDQSVLNTLNLLSANPNFKGFVSNQDNAINPLAKYSILTNNPISALGSISSSNLIPIITKISTVNSTSVKSSKNASENVIGVYNIQNTALQPGKSIQPQSTALPNLNLNSLSDSKLSSNNNLASQNLSLPNSKQVTSIVPVAIVTTTRTTSATLNPSSPQQNNSSKVINNNKGIQTKNSISGTATVANIQSRIIPEKGFQILDRSSKALSDQNKQSSLSSIFNPFESLIKSETIRNSSTTPQQIDESLTSSVLTNLIATLIPDLSQYSKQTKQVSETSPGSSKAQSRNFTVNLKNAEQTINNKSSNSSMDIKISKPDFSLKLEEDISTNISSLNAGQKQSTFTNIEKKVSSQTLLSVFSNSNIFSNSINVTNITNNKENKLPQIRQQPVGVIPQAQENNQQTQQQSFLEQFKPNPNINTILIPQEAPKLAIPQNQQQQIRYLQYLQKYKPFTEAMPPEVIAYKSSVFLSNLKLIQRHNSNKQKTYEMGLNKFTDVSEEEFLFNNAKLRIPEGIKKLISTQQILLLQGQNGSLIYSAPEQTTINHKCFASDVIDQGKCGPSWIISSLEAIQMSYRIYGVNVRLLSIQQIISCGTNNRTLNGCENGYFTGAYDYTRNFGVGQNQINYFYDESTKNSQQIGQCNISLVKSNNYYKNKQFIESSKRILYGNCKSLVNQLKLRPLSVGIQIKNFQFYKLGVFQNAEGAKSSLHGVTLIGYDPKNKYLIKNSWGTDWGQSGYAYVGESTGVCNYAMYPILGIQSEKPQLKCSQKL